MIAAEIANVQIITLLVYGSCTLVTCIAVGSTYRVSPEISVPSIDTMHLRQGDDSLMD